MTEPETAFCICAFCLSSFPQLLLKIALGQLAKEQISLSLAHCLQRQQCFFPLLILVLSFTGFSAVVAIVRSDEK